MSGLRIGLVTAEWPTGRGQSGGIGTYFCNLAVGLERCGARPVVLTGPPAQHQQDQLQGQFPVIHLPPPRPALTRRAWDRLSGQAPSYRAAIYHGATQRRAALNKHLPALAAEHDLHVLLGPLWAGELADLAPLTGLPVVVRASANLRQIVRANNDPSGSYDRKIHQLEQRALLACSAYYAPSHRALSNLLRCMAAPPAPEAVIPSGVDLERFKPAPEPAGRDRCRFLFVGRLEPQKGLGLITAILPRLFQKTRRAEMWFVGRDTLSAPGGTTWQEHLRQCCPESVFRRCRFFGRMGWDRLPDLYRRCDVMLVPSIHDNLPNSAIEAMASGLPVAASSGAGLDDLVRSHENGLILEVNQPLAWAEALGALAGDPPAIRRLGGRARTTVESHLSLEATVEPVIELCQRAMRRPRLSAHPAGPRLETQPI